MRTFRMKIVGAFVGGAACTGIAIAAVTVPWRGMISNPPSTSAAPPGQSAAPVTSTSHEITAQSAPGDKSKPNALNLKPQRTASERNPLAESPAGTQRSCDGQAWPYAGQGCQRDAQSKTSEPSTRRIRVISTDGNAPPSVVAARAGPTPAPAAATPQPPTSTVEAPNTAALAATPIQKPDVTAASSRDDRLPRPDIKAQGADVHPAIARNGDEPARPMKVSTEQPAADKPRQKHVEADHSRSKARSHRAEQRAARLHRRDAARSHDDDVAPGSGDVIVEKTYDLADGRRVTVTRSYPRGSAPELRAETPLQRLPVMRYRSAWRADPSDDD